LGFNKPLCPERNSLPFGAFFYMKYTININQKAVIDNNWTKLTLDHIAIIETVVSCINSRAFLTIQDNSGTWYWLKVAKIIEELPILRIKERRCKELINDLVEYNLLEINPNNKSYQKHYLRIGINYAKLQFDSHAENNKPMQETAKHYAENCKLTMQDNAYDNNTIYYNTILDNNNNKAENKKTFKEIKQERGIMTLEELVMEAINEETFMDRLMMNFGREKNMTVEIMKYYIKAIYSHWKYDLKLEHNNRREFRSHLINTINRDIFGNQRLYNQGIILLKNKKNTK
jgi:hypothetical protein